MTLSPSPQHATSIVHARQLIVFCGLAWAFLCQAEAAPLPPPRPTSLEAPAPVPPPLAEASPICVKLMAAGRVEATLQPPVLAAGGCGIAVPVLLTAIVLPDGNKVAVTQPALMRCEFAAKLAEWVRADVAPAIAAPDRLARLDVAGSYECRGRNRLAGAKISEHGTGNAIDIAAFVTHQGQRFEIGHQSASVAFFQTLKSSACLRFMTVLGPGSDGFHETHLHLDMQARANNSHYCHWTLP